MPRFSYQAIDATGGLVTGELDAASRGAVVEQLQASGHMPLSAEPLSGSGWAGLLNLEIGGRRGLRAAELLALTRELAVLLEAGQDLDLALRLAAEHGEARRLRPLLAELRDKVRGGTSLASALEQSDGGFPRLYLGMVRAGEAGGALAEAFARLAVLLERQQALTEKLRSAMIYPAILIVSALCTTTLLLVYVLPQFTTVFAQAGAQLPAATRFLMALADGLRAWGPLGLGLTALAALALARALRRPALRLRLDAWCLALPLLGGFTREVEATRLLRALGSLLRNGVSLLGALTVARDVVANRAVGAALDAAIARLREGGRLGAALAESGVLPPRALHLLELGEHTARLGEMALKAADMLDDTVQRRLERLVALLVPAVTIVMGLIVAGIVSSLLLAMLSLNDLAL